MKIISKKYWQDVKNLVEQISIQFRVFTWSRRIWFKCAVDKHTKISGKFVYQQIFKRSNTSSDNIGESIYRSVSSWNYRLVIDNRWRFFLLFYRISICLHNRRLVIDNRWRYSLLFFYRISICLYFLTIDCQPCYQIDA